MCAVKVKYVGQWIRMSTSLGARRNVECNALVRGRIRGISALVGSVRIDAKRHTGSIMDRSTILRHLKMHPTDPYTNTQLSEANLMPATELLPRYKAFVARYKI
jgi:hypothetical protein